MCLFELCAGSLSDCLRANAAGADRIELNSALPLGGLTPSAALFEEAKAACDLPIICMVRPREGGFHYSDEEFQLMLRDAELFLRGNAAGIAFGILHEDGSIDKARTVAMVRLIHAYGKEAVFHRAIDLTPDFEKAVVSLIEIGVDRILTSGQQASAPQGASSIRHIQKTYGNQIEILAGAGLTSQNAAGFLQETGVRQLHSSCKTFTTDPTTQSDTVSFAAWSGDHQDCYMESDPDEIERFAQAVHTMQTQG